jgi:SAM-dependent methyltransferase
MLRLLGSLPRRLRWRLQRWSSPADRQFHDALFSGQRYDPFIFAYPGYVTIRRFADLAEARFESVRNAVDLGCGPGEITCELARRRPEITFTGVDHSEAAIARAREHAAALRLQNVHFEAADISRYTPPRRPDIVLMFDAFHHLLDPAAFVRSMNTDRFLLIEPAGDWLGGWQKTIDLDWIAIALDTIRARIAWQLEETVRDGNGASATGEPAGAPVEHRYTMDDFRQFFDGFGLEARGTIAGLETYPPAAYSRAPLREEFGRVLFDTLVGIEDVLYVEDLDLHAKHWAIYAERGAPHKTRRPRPIGVREGQSPHRLQGSHDVEFLSYDGPHAAPPSTTIVATVSFRNNGWRAWSSDSDAPVFLSYHWLGANGVILVEDGVRTPLPRAVGPGETCTMSCRIETPPAEGRRILALDLVEEGVTWFSGAGAVMMKVEVLIRSG